jgi:hypothetical protein
MANLTRYRFKVATEKKFATMVEDINGEYVKFADIAEGVREQPTTSPCQNAEASASA